MTKLSLDEYLKMQEYFCKKNAEYHDIFICIEDSSISDDRKEELIESLKEQYKGYTNIFECDYYTDFNEEYIKTVHIADEDMWLDILTNVGEECETANYSGIFKGMVVTLDDYYYVVDVDGTEYWETAVSAIDF